MRKVHVIVTGQYGNQVVPGPRAEALVISEGGKFCALPALSHTEEGAVLRTIDVLDGLPVEGAWQDTAEEAVTLARAYADRRQAELVDVFTYREAP